MAKGKVSSQKYDIFSVLSFVFSIFSIIDLFFLPNIFIISDDIILFAPPILAITFGIVGRWRVKKYKYKGKNLYIAGIVIGVISLFLFYLFAQNTLHY